ncbi:MAG: hypothetical protein WCO71_01860 [Pseudomonadota bacterium]
MHELYVGREAWKNENMAVSDAKQWLAEIPIDDPSLISMLSKVAMGGYPKIQSDLTAFINVLTKSKHKHSEATLKNFTHAMTTDVALKIDMNRIPKSMRDLFLVTKP